MKINLTLEVSKFNKDKIVARTFKTRDGTEVTVKEYKVEVVELKQPKFVASGKRADGSEWIKKKTHFVAEEQTKEERAAKKATVYVGEGFTFEDAVGDEPQEDAAVDVGADENINPDDIPF